MKTTVLVLLAMLGVARPELAASTTKILELL